MFLKIGPPVVHRVGHRLAHMATVHQGLGHGRPHVLSTPAFRTIFETRN